MAESSLRSASETLNEIFLSPRVVDREAFNDFSGSLRRLIEGSSRQAEALRSAAEDARQAQSSLQATVAKHQGRFEAATKALAAVEARLAEVEQASRSAEENRERVERLQREAEASMRGRLDELAAHLEGMTKQSQERIRAAEADGVKALMGVVAGAEQKLAQVESRLIEFKARPAPVEAPAPLPAALPPPLPAMPLPVAKAAAPAEIARAEALVKELQAIMDRAAKERSLLSSAAVKAAEMSSQAAAAAGRVDEAAKAAEIKGTQLRSLGEQSELAKKMLMDAINTAAAQIDVLLEKAAGVEQTAAALEPACLRAEQRVSAVLARIETSNGNARTAIAETDAAVAQLNSVLESLQPWAPIILGARPGELPPSLQQAVEQARQQIVREAGGVAAALREVSSRLAG